MTTNMSRARKYVTNFTLKVALAYPGIHQKLLDHFFRNLEIFLRIQYYICISRVCIFDNEINRRQGPRKIGN